MWWLTSLARAMILPKEGLRNQMTSSSRADMSFIKEINKILGQNIREWGMYIALLVIMAFFTITTKGIFLSSRNIGNLINQTGYIAVLAAVSYTHLTLP